tara:strand:+ start:4066 stop:4641 length:576 start_codon:yes stop_codon:yes gene_type:complete
MIKVTIYGRLRKFIGQSTFEINADSPKKAFSFLVHNYPAVKEHIKDQEYCIMAGNIRITKELFDLKTESDIKIIPVVHGDIFMLAAGALFTAWGAGATILGITIGSMVQSAFLGIGINMLLNGVQDLFFPEPDPFGGSRQDDPQDQSYSFTGLLNNTKQGVPINIVYGEMLVGSTVVSSSVDTFQVTDEDD